MTTKTAAKKWGYKTEKPVQKICSSGIIFFAIKNDVTNKWEIPEMEKPPISRSGAVKYFEALTSVIQGAKPEFPNNAEEIYSYLSKQGFITPMDANKSTLVDKINGIQITDSGLELVQKEYKSNPGKYEIGAEVEVTLPFVRLKLNGNYQNK